MTPSMRSWCLPLYLWSLPCYPCRPKSKRRGGRGVLMSVGSFAADPAFPQLKIATDPALMKQTFRTHLRPVGGKVYDIQNCRLVRLRYRQGSHCFLLYTLRFVEPDTGRERDVQVSGIIYAEKDKAE